MAKRYSRNGYNLDFERMIAKGENTRDKEYGFEAQTANGTARCSDSSGWNRNDYQYPRPQAEQSGAWAKGSNRTGE